MSDAMMAYAFTGQLQITNIASVVGLLCYKVLNPPSLQVLNQFFGIVAEFQTLYILVAHLMLLLLSGLSSKGLDHV